MHVEAVCARLLVALGICCWAGTALGTIKRAEITSLHVDSDIQFRYATTQVTSRLKNPLDQKSEALFDVTLPNEAFITNLTLEVDGHVMVGEIQGREEAKRRYEAARDRGQTAGHIATRSRETNRFTLSVSVAPFGKVTFNLTYQELLRRKHGYYEQVVYIDPGQEVADLQVRISLKEARDITRLTVPPLRNDLDPYIADVENMTQVKRSSDREAVVVFRPDLDFQRAQAAGGLAGQFVLQYDIDRTMTGDDILLVNGYFVHFFAPENFQPLPSDVLFILDVSGSMKDTKMKQMKTAMLSILGQLNAHDRFNIITFSNKVSVWRSEMAEVADEDVREEALLHVQTLKAGGWTDIEKALAAGLDLMRPSKRGNAGVEVRSPIIMFLTDGEPTEGVMGTDNILSSVKNKNEGQVAIFSLAFGGDADYDLVKKIALQNHGIGRRIYEASDAAIQIAGFYSEIGVSLLSNLTFRYLDVPVENLTRSHYTNYFNGSEIVVCGRYEELHGRSLTVQVTASSEKGPGTILQAAERAGEAQGNTSEPNSMFEELTEKVWAYLTIKQLLEEETATTDNDQRSALKDRITNLALQYGFVTPHTSMVVTELADQPRQAAGEGYIFEEQAYHKSVQDVQVGLSILRPQSAGFVNPAVQHSDVKHTFSVALLRRDPLRRPYSVPSLPGYGLSMPYVSDKNVNGQRKRKFKKRKPSKNGRKQKGRGSRFLLALLPPIKTPICLPLSPSNTLLYEDIDKQLKISAMYRNKYISEITLTYSGIIPHTTVINKQTWDMLGSGGTGGAPWTLHLNPSKQMAVFTLDAFNLTVTNIGRKMEVAVSHLLSDAQPKPVGVIGRLLTSGLHEVSPGTFKVNDGHEYRAKKIKKNKCWKLKHYSI
ncbi:inter-alpha-trypsin inhibitor heavy chain H6-like isoform X2 [Mya arenaria]|uniref:inter-alpha-trypsin inhibitor heavy chain H6-like isoform X2 n=1 Tax=Mya arenaria TaxID=6604 RepID=UPI0022E04A16|nr:inter-alpha-trypsin inhibitor heavy chain H6-like isoform X2 [Mya arenaria]